MRLRVSSELVSESMDRMQQLVTASCLSDWGSEPTDSATSDRCDLVQSSHIDFGFGVKLALGSCYVDLNNKTEAVEADEKPPDPDTSGMTMLDDDDEAAEPPPEKKQKKQ